MSTFIENATELIKKDGIEIYRITEIKGGVDTTAELKYANPCQNIYSVSKVFTTTAVMMLWDRGLMSLDEKVCDVFKDELPEGIDPAWYCVTVDQLLTHRAGFAWGQLDIDCQDSTEYGDNDYLRLLFNTPLAFEPGKDFTYSDAAFYLLSRIVSKKLGEPMDNFLWRELFVPCKVREAAWSHCPMGYPMGATGLYIRSEDVAKLGEIYLNGGTYGTHRILSKEAVDTVLSRGYELNLSKNCKYYSKGGMRGSMLQIIPEKDRVVAWTACDDRDMSFLLNLACE